MATTTSVETRRLVDSRSARLHPSEPSLRGHRLGGKATALYALSSLGLPVPHWVCIPADCFANLQSAIHATFGERLAAIEASQRQAIRTLATDIRHFIQSTGIERALREEITSAIAQAFPTNAIFAIRSSAIGEDSATDSFAGQLDTFLFVPPALVLDKVLDCFASAYTERSIVYRCLRGMGSGGVATAVIVQEMVDCRAAGVLFTANPSTGNRFEAVVSAGLGLGEGVVSGQVETDTYFADLETGQLLDEKIAAKFHRVERADGHGTRLVHKEGPESSQPCLKKHQVEDLVRLGKRLQAHFGCPQDIEWGLGRDDKLCILQSRPITTLERETIFDCSNIVESYPGLSLPLTFSFVRHAYEQTFRESSRRCGVPEPILKQNHAVHAGLVALIDGRIYYNILNWYRLFQLIPGFESALPAWEKALGLQNRFLRSRPLAPAARLKTLPLRFRVIGSLLQRYVELEKDVANYFQTLAQVQKDFREKNLENLEPHELLELYEDISRRLLEPYAVSVLNDLYAQQLHEALGRLIERLGIHPAGPLRNELLCGERGMESVEPVRSLLALTEQVRQSPQLRNEVESNRTPAEVFELIRQTPPFASFHMACQIHLDHFGDRSLHELKLEVPSLHERPEFLIVMIRNYLRGGQETGAMEARERHIRERAEARVQASLRAHPLKKSVFLRVLEATRRTIRNRENLRLSRSRSYGMVKRIFKQVGILFHRQGILEGPRDVFYLTVDECVGAVRGMSTTRDLKALVRIRKSEYEEFSRSSPAPRVVTRGLVHSHRVESSSEMPLADSNHEAELMGIGCSPGRVQGIAKVVMDPDGDLAVNGEILVAPMTDPAWVFLMVAAKGLVAERGSILSHTAIIGRELGIPTVVGVPHATSLIRDGRVLVLDGEKGSVQLMAADDGGPPSPKA